MSEYINLKTLVVNTEYEIRKLHPNTSFPVPFSNEDYALIINREEPVYDIYSQTIILGNPVLSNEGVWERIWSIIQLEGDALIDAQAQKVEDEKAKIKSDIAALEAKVTPRRTREAILGTDNGWLADIELQIQALRGQL